MPDRLYLREHLALTSTPLLSVLDTSTATPSRLASRVTLRPFFNEAGDEILSLHDYRHVRLEPATLAEISPVTMLEGYIDATPVVGDRVLDYEWNDALVRHELNLVDATNGRTIAAHPLPDYPREMVGNPVGEVLLLFGSTWGSLAPGPTLTFMEPRTSELNYSEPVVLEYWARDDAVDLTIGGVAVPFELIDRGIRFSPPSLPVGSYDIDVSTMRHPAVHAIAELRCPECRARSRRFGWLLGRSRPH